MSEDHVLYRFFSGDVLLYVGITMNPGSRWKKHRGEKPWWLDVSHITMEAHPNREAVLQAEALAIRAEHPLYNIVHNRPANQRAPKVKTMPVVRQSKKLRRTRATDMPDECHDYCSKQGIMALVYPYEWLDGTAYYRCAQGHEWTCGWSYASNENGYAPLARGTSLPYLDPGKDIEQLSKLPECRGEWLGLEGREDWLTALNHGVKGTAKWHRDPRSKSSQNKRLHRERQRLLRSPSNRPIPSLEAIGPYATRWRSE